MLDRELLAVGPAEMLLEPIAVPELRVGDPACPDQIGETELRGRRLRGVLLDGASGASTWFAFHVVAATQARVRTP